MEKEKKIKCIIWDLDNTLWNGTLLEDKTVQPFQHIVNCIRTLDERGILHSIASRNNYDDAMECLRRFNLDEYFLHPQIYWGDKSKAVGEIIKKINISADTVAFVDDQPFELDEVKMVYPDVLCIPASDALSMLKDKRFIPQYITEDSKMRRHMYRADILREESAAQFMGTREEFLCTLNMEITISFAQDNDLERLVELTERTNQLNTTGYTYSYKQLSELSSSLDYKLLVVELRDKYGTSGKIGLALIKIEPHGWMIELLIMSCRVLSRGIGTILIDFILAKAQIENVNVYAKFKRTQRNKMMYMSYAMAGFVLLEQNGDTMILSHSMDKIRSLPSYVTVIDKTGATILCHE